MARVQSVGGIATVQGRFRGQPEHEDVGGDILNINVRLFAKTEVGLLAIDPRPQTYVTTIPRDALRSRQPHTLLGLLRAPEFLHPEVEDRTQGPWRGVIEDLRRTFSIETDAETLQALEFELLMDAELQRALNELLGE